MSNTVNNYTETDLGNISLNPRGEYDNSAAYEYLDTVSYRGGSYFCLAELETTITGIAPDAGRDSEHWQMIAAPGDMTPEYTAAYNNVINKAVQVETSRAAVELAQQEIEAVQTDVQQLHSDTVQAAQEAENSKNSAANSAQSAEQSRKTVSESEQNINGQIAGFDSRVSEAVEQSKEEINTTKQQAINTITNQQTASVNTVKTEGEKIITRVGNDAKTVADDRATVEEAAQTVLNNAQEVAQNTQTVASNTENVAASAESAKTSADNAAQSAKSVEDASKQIEQNKKDVASLKGSVSTKITKFYKSNQGETHVTDSDNGKIMDMMIYGKSSQDGTPTPENPVEIKSVVNPIVKVTNEDGLKVQSVTLNNITLNAIPVKSGGNVTIDGQQYIADYVDVEHGKVIRNILKWRLGDLKYGFNNAVWHMNISGLGIDGSKIGLSNMFKIQNGHYNGVTTSELYIAYDGKTAALNMRGMTDEEFKKWLREKNPEVYNVLTVAEEIPITLEEVSAFKQLMTYYPVTNVSVNSEQLDGYTVFNYPIPFEDTWNKAQKEIGGLKEETSSLKEDIIDCLKGTEIEVNNKTDKPFTDFNDVKTNSVYSVSVKDLLNMPVQAIGVLITIGYKPDSDFGCAQWYIVNGDVYVRLLNGTWGVWEKLYNAKNKDSDFVSNFNYMFPNAFDAKVSSAGIFKGRINTVKPSDNFDFDELKESVCVYNEDKNANGLPENDFGTMICFANKGNQTYGVFQVYSTYYTHRTYIRYRTGTWNEWKEIVTKDYFDNNFDAFPFTCFGVIGDSLASGCSNYQNSQGAWKGKDIPKFSWGKYIERKYGVECTLFTKGGTTTRSWLNGEWGKSLLESSEPLEMYYIGLGNNDYYSLGASYLGSASDIHIGNEEQNADTYYGNYSKIIAAIKSKSPRAKVFCFTEPNKNKDAVCHLFNEAVRNIIEMYDNVFLFDLEYNEKYMTNGIFKSFEYGSHYVSPGYKLMAEFIYKMTSDYILNNPNDFMDIQWITENHD